MAQNWDYKHVLRTRMVEGAAFGGLKMGEWEVFEDGKSLGKSVEILAKCKALGNDGCELVSVTSRSSFPGQAGTLAGVTTEESWIFKMAKS